MGICNGAIVSLNRASDAPTNSSNKDTQRLESCPNCVAVSLIDFFKRIAGALSNGCATETSGCIHSKPNFSKGNVLKNGDINPEGCTAEQTS